MPTKYKHIANVVARRIKQGDYVLNNVPAERELAFEQGVSHMTARKAVQKLVNDNILIRKPNGRLDINQVFRNGATNSRIDIAFLAPAWESYGMNLWRSAISTATQNIDSLVRPMTYVHWEDPIIMETMNSFHGVFLMPNTEAVPPVILEQLKSSPAALVWLDEDQSASGIVSICPTPTSSIRALLAHLWDLGHRTVDVLHTQPADATGVERIGEWNLWREETGAAGTLLNYPVKTYESPLPKAYDVMSGLLQKKEFRATALVCTTEPAAMGAVRAILDHGLVVGEDISVAVINDEGLARYLSPRMTAIEMTDPVPFITACAKWVAAGGGQWDGPLRLQPDKPALYIGESTGPPLRHTLAN
jgi:hypothetical protein